MAVAVEPTSPQTITETNWWRVILRGMCRASRMHSSTGRESSPRKQAAIEALLPME